MKAIKDNKSYTVNTDEEAKTYVSRGYDIQDDNGKIKEYGLGKKISVDDYNTVKKENSKLKAENKKLKESTKSDTKE